MLCESNCTKKKLMSNECTSLLRRRACVTNQFSLFVLLFFILLCSVGVRQCACALGYRCVDANTRTYSIQATHTHVRLTFFMLAVGNKTDATKRMRLLAQRAPGLRTNKKKFCLQINTYEIGMKKV